MQQVSNTHVIAFDSCPIISTRLQHQACWTPGYHAFSLTSSFIRMPI